MKQELLSRKRIRWDRETETAWSSIFLTHHERVDHQIVVLECIESRGCRYLVLSRLSEFQGNQDHRLDCKHCIEVELHGETIRATPVKPPLHLHTHLQLHMQSRTLLLASMSARSDSSLLLSFQTKLSNTMPPAYGYRISRPKPPHQSSHPHEPLNLGSAPPPRLRPCDDNQGTATRIANAAGHQIEQIQS